MRRPSLLLSFGPALLLGAGGCRTGGAGGESDALAIMEGRSASPVALDTIADPFSVTIGRARWSTKMRVEPARDFWSDIAVLDIASAEKAARTLDERTFVLALRTLMSSDPEGAAIAFGALHERADDAALRARARIGLTMALSWHSDWPAIARIGADPDSILALHDSLSFYASVERWAHALARIPSPTIFIPDEPVVLPMRRSAFGTPVITVSVNGKPHEFWLDTGASMTLLSASVAGEVGALLAAPDTLALGVVAGHIPARAIYLDSIAIGSVRAFGLSAALVNPGALRLDRRIVHGVAESVQIDGVIGTDLLRHLDILLDARDGTITIRKPRPNPRVVRNLFWVGYPVVRLVTKDGRPMLFGLDTGAEGTYATTALLRKLPHTPIAMRRMSMSGLGTERQETEWVARDVALSDGDYAVTLRNIPVTPDQRWTFVTFDGVIGSDVALGSRMHLDFTNGVFDIRPPTAGGIDVRVRQ
ncbi:MAG TPA: retropepsin-like aspartic protease [Gemmatimonadaceae bacterium]|jgi:hypothetical protein